MPNDPDNMGVSPVSGLAGIGVLIPLHVQARPQQERLHEKLRDAIWSLTNTRPSDHLVEQLVLITLAHFSQKAP